MRLERMLTFTSTGIPFSCGRDANDSTFCLHPDAICNRSDLEIQGEVCDCPPGYIHDYTSMRSSNCALPTWFLPAFFVITTIGCVWSLALLLPDVIFRLRSTLRQAVTSYCIAIGLLWLHVASVFAQDGNMVPGILFLGALINAMLIFGYSMFRVVVDPICATIGGEEWMKQRRRRFLVYFGFFSVSMTIVQLAQLVYADPSTKASRDTFNLIFLVQLGLMSSAYPLFGLVISYQTRRLIQTLEGLKMNKNLSGKTKSNHEAFLRQLHWLKTLARAMSLNCCVLIIPALLQIILGSVPYQFVFWGLNMLGIWPAAFLVKRSVRKRQLKEKVTESTPIVAATPSDVASNPKAVTAESSYSETKA